MAADAVRAALWKMNSRCPSAKLEKWLGAGGSLDAPRVRSAKNSPNEEAFLAFLVYFARKSTWLGQSAFEFSVHGTAVPLPIPPFCTAATLLDIHELVKMAKSQNILSILFHLHRKLTRLLFINFFHKAKKIDGLWFRVFLRKNSLWDLTIVLKPMTTSKSHSRI